MLIAICDDIESETKRIGKVVRDYMKSESMDIRNYSPEGLLLDLEVGLFKGDIVILDIVFHDQKYNGIDIGRQINSISPLCQIIYITNFDNYHSEVYDTSHCYFVKKEAMEKTLPRALAKAITIVNQNKDKEYIRIIENGKGLYIRQREIRLIEKSERVIIFYLENEKYMSYLSLKSVMGELCDSFARCHSGFVVNFEYIETVMNEKVLLKGGREIPVGRAFRKEFMQRYLKYMTDRI